jgi:hypothetical protein
VDLPGMPNHRGYSRFAGIAAILFLLTGPAAAGCQEELAEASKDAQNAQLEDDQMAQVGDMLKQAEQLCSAGNEEEAIDVVSEVRALINAE